MASSMEVNSEGPSRLPVVVTKPTPYTFDLGLLLASDPNPLLLTDSSNLEQDLAATARDGAQALLNQLLSTCPIQSTPSGVLLSLPSIETNLPREKVYFRLPSHLLQNPLDFHLSNFSLTPYPIESNK